MRIKLTALFVTLISPLSIVSVRESSPSVTVGLLTRFNSSGILIDRFSVYC
jgi:hypothetical protein